MTHSFSLAGTTDPHALTLASLNIHKDEHLELVRAFIIARKPDVICLQEVHRLFAEEVARLLGYDFRFSLRIHDTSRRKEDGPIEEGTMIAWHPSFALRESHVHVYNTRALQYPQKDPNAALRSLLTVTLEKDGQVFRIGTTHFTWTPDGSASEEQREDMHRMLAVLEAYHDEHGIVFCGDFNAPRGGEIYNMMSDIYTDNLPPEIMTTLDQKLHRSPPSHRSARAVDSIFSTKEYTLTDVTVTGGVSDHMALFANVSKNVC